MKLIHGFSLGFNFSYSYSFTLLFVIWPPSDRAAGAGKCLKNVPHLLPIRYCINVSIQIMSGIVVDLWMRVFIFPFHFHRQWGRRTGLAANMTLEQREEYSPVISSHKTRDQIEDLKIAPFKSI